MVQLTRPMLAAPTKPEDWHNLEFPVYVSPKLDGVRAMCVDGVIMSRTMKPIPNQYVQCMFGRKELNGLDGELIVGSPTDPNCMQNTMSGVMSRDGHPDVRWMVFDRYDSEAPFFVRIKDVGHYIDSITSYVGEVRSKVQLVQHIVVDSVERLLEVDETFVTRGYEGTMVRSPYGPYKQGRSTLKQGYLLKIKRFEDGEAKVIDVEEQMHNANEATLDERGYTKRSTHKDGKQPAGVLGALKVEDLGTGEVFGIGTGFTAEQRKNLWEGRKYLPGKIVHYRHFPVGRKDAPRFPTFISFRDKRDML